MKIVSLKKSMKCWINLSISSMVNIHKNITLKNYKKEKNFIEEIEIKLKVLIICSRRMKKVSINLPIKAKKNLWSPFWKMKKIGSGKLGTQKINYLSCSSILKINN